MEVPKQAFAYITSVATLGAIWSWGIIVSCLLVYRRRVSRGEAAASPFNVLIESRSDGRMANVGNDSGRLGFTDDAGGR